MTTLQISMKSIYIEVAFHLLLQLFYWQTFPDQSDQQQTATHYLLLHMYKKIKPRCVNAMTAVNATVL